MNPKEQGMKWNPGPLGYEAVVLTTRQQRSVGISISTSLKPISHTNILALCTSVAVKRIHIYVPCILVAWRVVYKIMIIRHREKKRVPPDRSASIQWSVSCDRERCLCLKYSHHLTQWPLALLNNFIWQPVPVYKNNWNKPHRQLHY
jgi:hypothetical protein